MRGTFNTIAFLEMYRDLPVLWDRNHVDYRNRAAREDAETKLLEPFNFTDTKDVRHKIRVLRNTYNLELQRINESIKNGANATTVYKPKLIWFELADSFLGKNLLEVDVTPSTSWVETADNGRYDDALGAGSVTVKSEDPPPRKKFRGRRGEGGRSKHSESCASGPYQTSEDLAGVNEFVVFGQHVAIQLEKLPLERSVRIQGEIQALLTKARLQSIKSSGFQAEYLTESIRDPISSDESS